MLRTALLLLLFASPAFAQDSSVNPMAAAGRGANDIHFDVKTTSSSTQPHNQTLIRLWST
jgi:hypothetical protein